ncbi:TetR family transcriptional regulator [Pseudactinotalea sp. Z1748]|uniref:acyl-CoA-like ligand-binding transcription factor n=1 Tax=Pseudactinotalea sp. Z1748 TaxID=3413027 RepID=UPI003C7B49A5
MTEARVRRRGRPTVSSAERIERRAIELFLEQGFDQTSMAQVAAACEVGRSTLFRYFPAKADIVWRGFDVHLRQLARALEQQPDDRAVMQAVHAAVIEAFAEAVDGADLWLQRFEVQNQSETLRPGIATRWLAWADEISHFVAARTETAPDHPNAAAVGGAVQGAYAGRLRTWLRPEDVNGDAVAAMDVALQPVCEVLTGLLSDPPRSTEV